MTSLNRCCLHTIYHFVVLTILFCFVSSAWSKDSRPHKEIRVFIKEQVLIALEDGKEIHRFKVVTGSHGKETTVGNYKIFAKHEKYVSHTYGSNMPYTMFFSRDGKAIHGTRLATLRSYLHEYLTESVGSKGCVGLTDKHAKILFDWAPIGTPVLIMHQEK
jgi:lipoprotein-anchoring transpeptidase ErfK/SrfK